jgi:hypothetical protein
MADITITIPNDKLDIVVDAFADQYNYQETIGDEDGNQIPNPTSKNQFAKNIIKSFVKQVYVAKKVKELDATRQTTVDNAETDVSGVTVS